jgi:hypothetical protein
VADGHASSLPRIRSGPTGSRTRASPIKSRAYGLTNTLGPHENLQRWELNPLSNGYEPSRSPFAFAAIELDVPTGNAPVASVLQTEWFTCSIGHKKMVRCVGLAPTRQASQA